MNDHDQIPQSNQHLNSLFGKFGFSKLTEIQKKASPIILQKNCLVITSTGSGKIECSVIPIFSLVKNAKKLEKLKLYTLLY